MILSIISSWVYYMYLTVILFKKYSIECRDQPIMLLFLPIIYIYAAVLIILYSSVRLVLRNKPTVVN